MQKATDNHEETKEKRDRAAAPELRRMDLDNPRHVEAIRWWAEFKAKRARMMRLEDRNAEPKPTATLLAAIVAQRQMLHVASTRDGRAALLKMILKSRGIERCGETTKKETCDRAKGHLLPHCSAETSDKHENVDANHHAICRHYSRLILRLLDTLGAPAPRDMAIAIMGEFSKEET